MINLKKINERVKNSLLRKRWRIEEKVFKFGVKYKKISTPSKAKIKTIIFDTSDYHSEMCELSMKLNSDKSPYNASGHRHAYTGIYHYLFNKIKNMNLNIGEIGIKNNIGIKLFREYFKNARIYGFEFDKKYLDNAKIDNLHNVYYDFIDVRNSKSIITAFKKTNVQFDIIFDDSTHFFQDQINVMNNAHLFMKKNATLIIEDIYEKKKGYSQLDYYQVLKNNLHHYSDCYFIESRHVNEWSSLWHNSKILVLEKN